jgi:hypothetical protein
MIFTSFVFIILYKGKKFYSIIRERKRKREEKEERGKKKKEIFIFFFFFADAQDFVQRNASRNEMGFISIPFLKNTIFVSYPRRMWVQVDCMTLVLYKIMAKWAINTKVNCRPILASISVRL